VGDNARKGAARKRPQLKTKMRDGHSVEITAPGREADRLAPMQG
jgi:hypothetical protein